MESVYAYIHYSAQMIIHFSSLAPVAVLRQFDGRVGQLTLPTPAPPQSQWLVSPSFVASPSPVLLSSPILASPVQLPWSPQNAAQGMRAVAMVPPFPGGIFPPLSGVPLSLSRVSLSPSGISPSLDGISPPVLPYSSCLVQLRSPTPAALVQNHVLPFPHQRHPSVTSSADAPHSSKKP